MEKAQRLCAQLLHTFSSQSSHHALLIEVELIYIHGPICTHRGKDEAVHGSDAMQRFVFGIDYVLFVLTS